jgi:hypothetical protein
MERVISEALAESPIPFKSAGKPGGTTLTFVSLQEGVGPDIFNCCQIDPLKSTRCEGRLAEDVANQSGF